MHVPRAHHGGEQDVALPAAAAEALVDARADVAGRRAQQHPRHQRARHQRAAVGRRQEAEARERQRHQRHAEHLQSHHRLYYIGYITDILRDLNK